jgi:hypothetical protein
MANVREMPVSADRAGNVVQVDVSEWIEFTLINRLAFVARRNVFPVRYELNFIYYLEEIPSLKD